MNHVGFFNPFKAEAIQVIDNGKLVADPIWIERITGECNKILASGHRFAANYSPMGLKLYEHLSFDLLVQGDEIVTWAGLFNGGRYPEGVFRIMNRLYINPKFRSHTLAYVPYARDWLLPRQIQRHQDRIKLLFLSREGLRAKFFLKRWVKCNAPDRLWEILPELVEVAPYKKRSCYQYVAIRQFAEVAWCPTSLSIDDWMLLPP